MATQQDQVLKVGLISNALSSDYVIKIGMSFFLVLSCHTFGVVQCKQGEATQLQVHGEGWNLFAVS